MVETPTHGAGPGRRRRSARPGVPEIMTLDEILQLSRRCTHLLARTRPAVVEVLLDRHSDRRCVGQPEDAQGARHTMRRIGCSRRGDRPRGEVRQYEVRGREMIDTSPIPQSGQAGPVSRVDFDAVIHPDVLSDRVLERPPLEAWTLHRPRCGPDEPSGPGSATSRVPAQSIGGLQ